MTPLLIVQKYAHTKPIKPPTHVHASMGEVKVTLLVTEHLLPVHRAINIFQSRHINGLHG